MVVVGANKNTQQRGCGLRRPIPLKCSLAVQAMSCACIGFGNPKKLREMMVAKGDSSSEYTEPLSGVILETVVV